MCPVHWRNFWYSSPLLPRISLPCSKLSFWSLGPGNPEDRSYKQRLKWRRQLSISAFSMFCVTVVLAPFSRGPIFFLAFSCHLVTYKSPSCCLLHSLPDAAAGGFWLPYPNFCMVRQRIYISARLPVLSSTFFILPFYTNCRAVSIIWSSVSLEVSALAGTGTAAPASAGKYTLWFITTIHLLILLLLVN